MSGADEFASLVNDYAASEGINCEQAAVEIGSALVGGQGLRVEGPESGRMQPLLPAESMALTVALAQIQRGEEPTPNVATVCIYALARLADRYDYTEGAAAFLMTEDDRD